MDVISKIKERAERYKRGASEHGYALRLRDAEICEIISAQLMNIVEECESQDQPRELKANELSPHVMGMYCPHCGSDDIVWYGLSGDCVCNKCGEEGNITL